MTSASFTSASTNSNADRTSASPEGTDGIAGYPAALFLAATIVSGCTRYPAFAVPLLSASPGPHIPQNHPFL